MIFLLCKRSQVQGLPAFGGAKGDQGSPFRVTFVHYQLQVQATLFSAADTQHPYSVLFIFGFPQCLRINGSDWFCIRTF